MSEQDWQKNLDEATVMSELARTCWAEGDYEKANSYLLQSLHILENQFGSHHIPLVRVLRSLGLLARVRVAYDEAETYYLRALEICRKLLGDRSPATARAMNYLAGLYNAQAEYQKAEELLLSSLKIYQSQPGFKKAEALVLMALTLVCRRQEKLEEAQEYRTLMKALHSKLEFNKDDLKIALSKLADFFYSQDRLDEADLVFRYGLILGEEEEFPQHPFVAESLLGLARLYADYDAVEESELLYRRAIVCFEKLYGKKGRHLHSALFECAQILKKQHKLDEAMKLEKKAELANSES